MNDIGLKTPLFVEFYIGKHNTSMVRYTWKDGKLEICQEVANAISRLILSPQRPLTITSFSDCSEEALAREMAYVKKMNSPTTPVVGVKQIKNGRRRWQANGRKGEYLGVYYTREEAEGARIRYELELESDEPYYSPWRIL